MMMRLELTISTDWARISMVRQAVSACVMAVFHDQVLGQDMAMSSAELLENAVKYGAGEQVTFSLTRIDDRLEIIVTNAIEPGVTPIDGLRRRLEWISRFSDPAEAYATAVDEAAASGIGAGSSGLGLVRIVCEGGLKLELDDSRPGRVVMYARRQLPATPAVEANAARA